MSARACPLGHAAASMATDPFIGLNGLEKRDVGAKARRSCTPLDPDERLRRVIERILDVLRHEVLTEGILRLRVGVDRQLVSRGLRLAVEDGVIERHGPGRPGNPYLYAASSRSDRSGRERGAG